MPYSNFTLDRAIEKFDLHLIEADFLIDIPEVQPSQMLSTFLDGGMALAIDPGSEKARSEFIIAPLLLELRNLFDRQISVFSGIDFTVDLSQELNGICDFLVSKSPIQLVIEAPAIVIIEAKKGDINLGLGQCVAEMVAAQRFNHLKGQPTTYIYGCVTTGTLWRFLRLDTHSIAVERQEHNLLPLAKLLGMLKWLVEN
jgi:hypothetical protein